MLSAAGFARLVTALGLVVFLGWGIAGEFKDDHPSQPTAPQPAAPRTCADQVHGLIDAPLRHWASVLEATTWDRAKGAELRPLADDLILKQSWPRCASGQATSVWGDLDVLLQTQIRALQFGTDADLVPIYRQHFERDLQALAAVPPS